MSFARRVGIGATAAILVPLVFALLISLNYQDNVRRTRELVDRNQRALLLTSRLERLVIDMETGNRGFRVGGDEIFLEPYRSAVAEYGPIIGELRSLLPPGEEQSLLSRIHESLEAWRQNWAEPRIAFIREHPPIRQDGGTLMTNLPDPLETAAGKATMDRIRGLFGALEKRQAERLQRDLAARDRQQERLTKLLWGLAAGFSLFLALATVLLGGSYNRRMGVLFAGIDDVERGSFTPISLGGSDEPGRMAKAFNRMLAELGKREGELRKLLDASEKLGHERAEALGALRESEGRLQSILDNTTAVIQLRDVEGRFLLVNRRFETLLHRKREELIGRTAHEALPAEIADSIVATDQKVLESGAPVELEVPVSIDDRPHTFLAVRFPLRDSRGAPYAICSISNDITDRKVSEEKIRALNLHLEGRIEELAEANRELESFSYSISHDLRAPLRHITGFSELLKAKASDLDEKSRHYLTTISTSARNMGTMIDELLVFSRMARAELHTTTVKLQEIVADVQRELEPETRGREILWRIDGLPTVQGDPSLLRLAIGNLIGNAVKYTRMRERAEIEIGRVPGTTTETIVFVRDNGAGFDMRYVDKLFGVFQRLHRQEDFEGTGIGLANVRRIVQRHGGRTWAEGSVDAGATFYFSLPNA